MKHVSQVGFKTALKNDNTCERTSYLILEFHIKSYLMIINFWQFVSALLFIFTWGGRYM